ncbi:hypothetical protein JZO70_20675 [Enterococcus sp. 669A]|uniref:Phage protein n=1 Tax=Candidatus Enterococcus moelleringii TaxID=2815325 RepID=A0ABS3LG28_9ENTE|nr:hypothetical protein [Enterococcus sp. 669A]MBO1308601.1 hypothetical protein [Enterococcus sp. 669A]
MKWMEKIRKHWLLFMLGAFFIPLIVVQLVFSDTLIDVFDFGITWDASDMVSYCISFMSMIGTLFLGFATHRQGDLLNETEKNMERHTHMRALSERQPSILLLNGKTADHTEDVLEHKVQMAKAEYDEDLLELEDFLEDEPDDGFLVHLTIVNSSKTFLEMRYLVLSTFEDSHYEESINHFGNEDFYVSLAPGEKRGLALVIDKKYKEQLLENYYQLSFEMYNSIGERYVERVKFVDTNAVSKRNQERNQDESIDTVAFSYEYFIYDYDKKEYEEL